MQYTSRQRMLDAFNYNNPDKIPVFYNESKAGLYKHGQKLMDLFNEYPPDNPVKFTDVSVLPENAVNGRGEYHEFIKDE